MKYLIIFGFPILITFASMFGILSVHPLTGQNITELFIIWFVVSSVVCFGAAIGGVL